VTWRFTTLPHRQCKCPLVICTEQVLLGPEAKNWMLPLAHCSSFGEKFTRVLKEKMIFPTRKKL